MIAQSEMLNTTTYTSLQLGVLAIGHLSWAVLYAMVLRNIRRHGVVEIPAAAVAANFAYVTVWGILRQTDHGSLFVWLNRGGFILELLVFGYVLLNGARHIRIPEVKRWFKPGMLLSYACWAAMLVAFANQPGPRPVDASVELVAGFIVSLTMSTMYVVVELSEIEPQQYSLVAGWAKLVGNGCASAFCLMVFPTNHFLLSLCAITLVLDLAYLWLFRQRQLVQPSPVPA
ncbi:MAG: hypothetical protein ABI852_08295 [Gemmatimonadaceae bacterium]